MMNKELLNFASDAVTRAIKLGADSADAMAFSSEETNIDILNGHIEKTEREESHALGLRIFKGQSCAIVSCNNFTPEILNRLVNQGLAMAHAAPPDPYNGLATHDQLAQEFVELNLCSKTIPEPSELAALAQKAEAAALAVQGISRAIGSQASSSRSHIALVTSNGFAKDYHRTYVSFSTSVLAGSGTGMERDYDYSTAVHMHDLEAPEIIGRRAGERAIARLNPRKIKSQSVPVFYDRRVAASLLGAFASAINGAAIARGTSFLKDQLHKQIFSSSIKIVDDPLRKTGLSSQPFDGEGLSTQRRDLVDGGVLTGFLLDLSSARQLNLKPTANASRSISSPPYPTASNLYMEAGSNSVAHLQSAIKQGFYITELIGHGTDLVTGDYSRGASGLWIENGELTHAVSEVTIAGNLRDMFKNLTAADDLEMRSSVCAPTCLIEGLTIAGL